MLITNLLPLLERYSLAFDLTAGPDQTVTLTVIPRKADGGKAKPEAGEIRPISMTATAAEIDAELAKGADGALGQLIVARKSLAEQIAEQQAAADTAKTAVAQKSKVKPAASTAKAALATPPSAPAEQPKPGEPASLWT